MIDFNPNEGVQSEGGYSSALLCIQAGRQTGKSEKWQGGEAHSQVDEIGNQLIAGCHKETKWTTNFVCFNSQG